VELDETKIMKRNLFTEMVAHAWYTPKNKFLEDYLTIVPDISLFEKQRVYEQIQQMATIARNNGFELLLGIDN